MEDFFSIALAVTWWVFAGYWLWSARNVKHVARGERWLPRFVKYWLPLLVAGALIFGPGEAKLELKARLARSKALAACVIDVEAADTLTEPQIVAKVKAHFTVPRPWPEPR